MWLICEARGEELSPEIKVKAQGINWESWNCLSLVTPSCYGLKACALLLFHRTSTVGSAGSEWRPALLWPSERVKKPSLPCSSGDLASEKQFSQMWLGYCSPNYSEISSFRQKMISILMQHGENIPLLFVSGQNHMKSYTVSADFTFYMSNVFYTLTLAPLSCCSLLFSMHFPSFTYF